MRAIGHCMQHGAPNMIDCSVYYPVQNSVTCIMHIPVRFRPVERTKHRQQVIISIIKWVQERSQSDALKWVNCALFIFSLSCTGVQKRRNKKSYCTQCNALRVFLWQMTNRYALQRARHQRKQCFDIRTTSQCKGLPACLS